MSNVRGGRVSVMRFVRNAPLRGPALLAALELFPEAVVENVTLYDDLEALRLLLSMSRKLPASHAAALVSHAVGVLPDDLVGAVAAADGRLTVAFAGCDVLSTEDRSRFAAKFPKFAPRIHARGLEVSLDALEAWLGRPAEPPFPATMLATAFPDLDPVLAARIFVSQVSQNTREAHYFQEKLAAHELLLRPGVVSALFGEVLVDCEVPELVLPHLMTGPFLGADRAVVEDVLVRELTVERMVEAPDWLRKVFFFAGVLCPNVPPAVRDTIRAWAAEFGSAEYDPYRFSFTDAAGPRLLDWLEAGGAPFPVSSPNGLTVDEYARKHELKFWQLKLDLPGVGLPARVLSGEVALSDDLWALVRTASAVVSWADELRRFSGYQAIRLFWPPLLLPLFGQLLSEDELSTVRHVLSTSWGNRLLPRSVLEAYGVEDLSSASDEYRPPYRDPVVVDLYSDLEAEFASDERLWRQLFELCETSGLGVVEAAAVIS